MAKTCAEMIARVKYLVGRYSTTSNLPLAEIVLDALNEAHRKIAARVPNCLDLEVVDTTTFDATTDQYEYNLATLTNPYLWHLKRVFVLNGLSSLEVKFMARDRFDRNFPVVSSVTAGFPGYYTRKGNTLVFSCPFSSDYNTLAIRLDYEKKPTVFATTDAVTTSDFADADDGLILYGQYKALDAIARGDTKLLQAAQFKKDQWEEWLTEFEERHDLETEENPDDMPETMMYEEL